MKLDKVAAALRELGFDVSVTQFADGVEYLAFDDVRMFGMDGPGILLGKTADFKCSQRWEIKARKEIK
jgi:hypothetical protein